MLFSYLLFSISISKSLFQKTILQLLLKYHQISFELLMIFNTSVLKIVVYILIIHLVNCHVSYVSFGKPQYFLWTFRVGLGKPKFIELLVFYSILVELVENKMQYFFGFALAMQENSPEAWCNRNGNMSVGFNRREDYKLS